MTNHSDENPINPKSCSAANKGNCRPNPLSETVTLQEWLIMLFLLLIPVVNLILPIVFSFFGDIKKSQRNFFRAYLVVLLIILLLVLMLAAFLFVLTFFSIDIMNKSNYI